MLENYKKLNSSIKLTRSNLFCMQFIEKNNWGANEKRLEKWSVINLYWIAPPPPIP